MSASTFKTRLRVKDKATGRTGIIQYGSGFVARITTGEKRFVPPCSSGYKEYNDDGEPVLDSWLDQA